MKNLRVLVPIIMVVLMAFSCYSLVSEAVSSNKEYKGYLNAAREAASKKITVDVEQNYSNAIALKKSLEVYLEWGNYYLDTEQYDLAVDFGENLIDLFPKKALAYEYLLNCYLKTNNVEDFFDEYEHACSVGAINDNIEKIYSQSKYLYKLDTADYVEVNPFASKLAKVLVKGFSDNTVSYGFANENGDIVVKSKYKKAGDFNSVGKDEVIVAPVVDENGEAFFIDNSGNRKYVITPNDIKVVELGMYQSGVFSVFDGKEYYLCDINSNIISGPFKYISAVNINVGVVQDNDGWKIINNKGEIISKDVFDGFAIDDKSIAFRKEVLFANKGGKYYLVNNTGEKICDTAFEDAKVFVDSYAAVKLNGKWGYIDNKGNVVVDYKYDDAKSFSNGFAPVSVNGKWGYIVFDEKSKNVEIAVEPRFEDAQIFSTTSKVAFVKVGDDWNLLKFYLK